MSRNVDIAKELNALESPLADFPKAVPYAAPEGYFDALPALLMDSICFSEMDDPDTSNLPKTLPFAAPPDYFEQAPAHLVRLAINNDWPSSKEVPFAVPAFYLEDLPAELSSYVRQLDAQAPRRGKTIALMPAWRKWAGVAAAAVLLLTCSLGGYHFFAMRTPDAIAVRQLSKLDAESISSYVEQHLDDFDESTLENFVATQPASSTALPTFEPDDIQQYLEQSGDLPANEKESTL